MMRSLFRNLLGGLRLSLFGKVRREDFDATGEAFAILVLLNLAILFLAGFAEVGSAGRVSEYDLARAGMSVALILAFGLIAARCSGDRGIVLVTAVGLIAAGATIDVCTTLAGWLFKRFAVPGNYWELLYYVAIGWWALATVAASVRLGPAAARGRVAVVVAGLALLVAPAWWLPQGPLWVPASEADAARGRLLDEHSLYSQMDALPSALAALEPGRPGVTDVYLVAAGLYAREDVFMKEVALIAKLFRDRFDATGRSLVLVNNAATASAYPLATLTSLTAGLKRVSEVMDAGEDVLVLYLSSHGSEKHELSVDFPPLRLDPIDPPALKKALDEAGIKWKVVIVSACYSGGFVEPLKDDFTAVITASSATKQSFGCGSESDATYLARALFDEELRKTYSIEKAFEGARKSIEERERSQGYAPSEPQIHVGPALRDKLAEIERRLAAR